MRNLKNLHPFACSLVTPHMPRHLHWFKGPAFPAPFIRSWVNFRSEKKPLIFHPENKARVRHSQYEPNVSAKTQTEASNARGDVRWAVEFRNVSFEYQQRQGASVLRHLSFCVKEGEFLGILGRDWPKQSGKKSLLHESSMSI